MSKDGAMPLRLVEVLMRPKPVAFLVVLILFLIFLFQNTQVVTIHLFFWEISMSQILLVLLVLIVGFVSGFMVERTIRRRKKVKESGRR